HRDFRVLPRANRAFATGRSPSPGATSSRDAPPAFEPWPPWQSSARDHGQVEELTPPLRLRAHRNLCRFHQQKTEQCVALFADVTESPAIAAGLRGRNQTHIAEICCA